jgi:hypothetical protein
MSTRFGLRRLSGSRGRRRRLAVLALLAAGCCAGRAYGWGSGHATQAQMVIDALPAEIRAFFPPDLQRRIVQVYCMYPDTARTFDEALLGRETVAELERVQKLTTGRLLHDDISVALSMALLSKSFAERDPARAAVWLGSLIHTIGDDGCHLPLLAYASEIARFNVKKSKGLSDLSQIAEAKGGREKLKALMAGFKPRIVSEDPAEAVRKLIVLTYRQMDHGAQRQSRLTASFTAQVPAAARDDAAAALAELGAEGARHIVDAALTAWRFAQQQRPVELTAELIQKGREEGAAFCAAKPLENDSVYAGIFGPRPEGPAVGVVVEPSTFMGRSSFSYGGAVTLAQVVRALRTTGIPCVVLDSRRVEQEGLPSAESLPAVVVCAGSFYCSQEPFRKYTAAGGRLLWIGGRDKKLLGKLSDALKPADPAILPVSMTYGDPNTAVVARVTVSFLGELQPPLGKAPLAFVNNPNLGGWMTPKCGLQVDATAPDIRPLASVSDGTTSMTVAGALVESGRPRHIFLPEYLLVPFVLSRDDTLDFSKPEFDRVGRAILLTSIRMLVPELAGAK